MSEFDKITRDFHKPTRKQAHPALGCGVLLLLLAVLAIIPWGFGADRFLWVAAGTAGLGAALVLTGAALNKR